MARSKKSKPANEEKPTTTPTEEILEEEVAGQDVPVDELIQEVGEDFHENLPVVQKPHLPLVPEEESVESATKSEASSSALVEYDPLEVYLTEIRRHPPLSREEEHELAVRFKKFGDRDAAYRLIVSNLRLVVMIAREYQRNVQNVLDLVQEGNIGLLEAVKQFDPFRGIRFPSYAVYWIRAYMLRYLINNIRLVKVGTTQAQRKLFFNLQKEKERLESEGFAPEAALLAKRLGVKESEVVEMEQRLALPDLSVDTPVKAYGEDGGDLHGVLADPGTNVETQVVQGQFDASVREAVDEFKQTLDEKERAIIDERLFTEDPATLQAIADKYGLSRERIRQIEVDLKERLRDFLKDRLQLGDEGEILVE